MLYYSHVNEDNAIERSALMQQQPETLIGITGSGERLLALMDAPTLRQVIAVDNNPEAQYLFELKLVTLKHLPVDAYLAFIGHSVLSPALRLKQAEELLPLLSESARIYWQTRLPAIAQGVLNAGHFERYLNRLRPLVRFLLGARFMECFKKPVTDIPGFPHWRWRLLLYLFSQTWVYRLTGNADLAFVAPDCDTPVIANALRQTVEQNTCSDSFVFHLIFHGHLRTMAPEGLPPSLQPAVLEAIQRRLRAGDLPVSFVTRDVRTYLHSLPPTADRLFMSLSDLQSFVPAADVVTLLQTMRSQKPPGSLEGVLRCFLRNPFRPEDLEQLSRFALIRNLSDRERSRMYRVYQFSM